MTDRTNQMNKWEKLPSDSEIEKTIESLKKNGIDALVVKDGEEAKQKVLEIMPKGAEVMNMTSATLDTISVTKEILEGHFNPVRKKLLSMDKSTQGREMKKLGSAPEWAIGSVHAVTEDGKVMIASATGSQLSAYSSGASKIIWVVGTHKIVKDQEEGFKRIYEHSLPLEDARARKVYGSGSAVSKILIVNKEVVPGRITLIFVKEKLGF